MEKYKKYTNRIESLVKEFKEEIYPKRLRGNFGGYDYPDSMCDKLEEWLMKVENILRLIFSENSIQIKRFRNLRDDLQEGIEIRLYQIKGLLEACLDDLNNGFIQGQEFIIANEVFDSILAEAEFILKQQKNKDISAILLRIVLEDSLKRIAGKEKILVMTENGKNKKASILNEELKTKEFYNQTTWRQIQVWLDIGNEAAHGNFNKYNYEQVLSFYEGLNSFIINHFR